MSELEIMCWVYGLGWAATSFALFVVWVRKSNPTDIGTPRVIELHELIELVEHLVHQSATLSFFNATASALDEILKFLRSKGIVVRKTRRPARGA